MHKSITKFIENDISEIQKNVAGMLNGKNADDLSQEVSYSSLLH